MSELRISLIIPAYNEERYLAKCLDSVAKQTLQPLEVLVVDNNSTDKTTEIAAKYDFVTIIREAQQGIVYARNAGFERAKGDLLVRIDADVHLPADWVERLDTAAMKRHKIAAFTGRGRFYDAPWPRLLGLLQAVTYQLLQWPACGSPTLWGATMAVRREAWVEVKNLCHRRTDVDEDIDLTIQLRRRGLRIAFLPRLVSEMSLRRDKTDPKAVAAYLATWPRDYWVNGRHIAAVYIGLLTGLTFVVSVLLWLASRGIARVRRYYAAKRSRTAKA